MGLMSQLHIVGKGGAERVLVLPLNLLLVETGPGLRGSLMLRKLDHKRHCEHRAEVQTETLPAKPV